MKKNLKNTVKEIQTMAVPIEIPMTSSECETVKAYQKELSDCGFNCVAGNYSIKVDSMPDGLNINDIPDIMTVLVEQLNSNIGSIELTRDIVFEKALYQASCKAAIKAGREYADENIVWLVDQLMKIPDITFCPHGRPVAIEIKKSTFDRQFKRI